MIDVLLAEILITDAAAYAVVGGLVTAIVTLFVLVRDRIKRAEANEDRERKAREVFINYLPALPEAIESLVRAEAARDAKHDAQILELHNEVRGIQHALRKLRATSCTCADGPSSDQRGPPNV